MLFLNNYSFLFTGIHSYLPVFLKPIETSPFTPLLFVKVVCFSLSTYTSTPDFPVYNVTMYSFLLSSWCSGTVVDRRPCSWQLIWVYHGNQCATSGQSIVYITKHALQWHQHRSGTALPTLYSDTVEFVERMLWARA